MVHYTAPPLPGGVEYILAEQAALLRGAGYDVTVVAGRGDAEIIPELDSGHPDVESANVALRNGLSSAADVSGVRSRIAAQLPAALAGHDVVIAHNVMTMPFNLGLTDVLADIGLPLVAWTHDIAAIEPDRYSDYLRAGRPYTSFQQAVPGATYVTISEVRRDQLAKAFGLAKDDITVVPNGIDQLAFAGLGPRVRQILAAADATQADPLILIPQRVTRTKGLDVAIDVAAKVRGMLPNARIIVTGPIDPHDRQSIAYGKALLRKRAELGVEDIVHFCFEAADPDEGHPVRTQDVFQLYRIADAIFIPSRREGFGLPLVEAALARVPVVCTDIPPFRELAGDTVYQFPVGADAEEIAELLVTAVDSPAVRHRRESLRRHAWSSLLPVMEGVLTRAVGTAVPGTPVGKGQVA